MFESQGNGKSLTEERFESWLEKGRESQLGYLYLLVIWNAWDQDFQPIYAADRGTIEDYQNRPSAQESLVAAYDLYSESRVSLDTN